MPQYRFTGKFYAPPDRGDYHGTYYHMEPHVFEAEDDAKALEEVARFQQGKIDIHYRALVRVAAPEQATSVVLPEQLPA